MGIMAVEGLKLPHRDMFLQQNQNYVRRENL